MTIPVLHRLRVVEDRDQPALVQRTARALGINEIEALGLLTSANGRLRELLHLEQSPLQASAHGSVRVSGVAGLIRLSPQLEFEVVPKFLDPADPTWQEDFFVLALFSQTGRILPREHLRAGHADRGDLATLVGRTLAQLYWENHRRPLRIYQRRSEAEYSYDGEVDPVGLVLPEPDGFPQTRITLDRSNQYNAVIDAAVQALLPEVRDTETLQQLLRVHHALAPQRPMRRARHTTLPPRHRHWQQLHDLAVEVLNGFGLGYNDDELLAPGYVLRTWTTWQSLCEIALRAGLAGTSVHAQLRYPLGKRGDGSTLLVTPDIVLGAPDTPLGLLDAKYRTRLGRRLGINASDVYETLAFMRAAGCDLAILLYPRPASEGLPQPVGTCTQFDLVEVASQRIIALAVECRGISGTGGFFAFSATLASAVGRFVQLGRTRLQSAAG
jgi:hypothetical protein